MLPYYGGGPEFGNGFGAVAQFTEHLIIVLTMQRGVQGSFMWRG